MLLKLPLRVLYPTNTRHEAVLHRIQSLPLGTETRIERNDSRRGKDSGLEGVSYSPSVDEWNRNQHEAKKHKCQSDELRASAPFEPSTKPREPTIIRNPNPNPANPSDERLTTPRTRPKLTDLGGFGSCSVTRTRSSRTRTST